MNASSLYSSSIDSIRPSVNHTRTPDSARRYAVAVGGTVRYTDSSANAARWTLGHTVGTVCDRGAPSA